jgi:hypothetical protein
VRSRLCSIDISADYRRYLLVVFSYNIVIRLFNRCADSEIFMVREAAGVDDPGDTREKSCDSNTDAGDRRTFIQTRLSHEKVSNTAQEKSLTSRLNPWLDPAQFHDEPSVSPVEVLSIIYSSIHTQSIPAVLGVMSDQRSWRINCFGVRRRKRQ